MSEDAGKKGWLANIFRQPQAPAQPSGDTSGKVEPDAFRLGRWFDPPSISRRRNDLLLGGRTDENSNFTSYALKRWGGKLPRDGLRALVIGPADEPPLADWLARSDAVAEIWVADADPSALRRIRSKAKVSVFETDWRAPVLPAGPFHVAIACECMSRIGGLEALFDQLSEKLVTGGLLVVRDYVGPNRCQFTDEQMDLVNAILALLPEKYVKDLGGGLVTRLSCPELGWMLENEPGAAVRAEDVPGLVRSRMRVCEEIQLGGAILTPLLSSLSHNFLDESEQTKRILDALWETERLFLKAEMIHSDNLFIVAWNPPRPGVAIVSG